MGENKFPERLRNLRKRRRMNQKALSEICGVSKNMIARYERGENEPKISVLKKMVEFFEVSADYLIGTKNFF